MVQRTQKNLLTLLIPLTLFDLYPHFNSNDTMALSVENTKGNQQAVSFAHLYCSYYKHRKMSWRTTRTTKAATISNVGGQKKRVTTCNSPCSTNSLLLVSPSMKNTSDLINKLFKRLLTYVLCKDRYILMPFSFIYSGALSAANTLCIFFLNLQTHYVGCTMKC